MLFDVITIFPELIAPYLNGSMLGRAQKNDLVSFKLHNLRNWTSDVHHSVDDTPYGGGAGMVMKIEPLYLALQDLTKDKKTKKQKIILLSAKGQTWNQKLAQKYSKLDRLILICGRYEGVDERITNFIDEEISIGDYVLTGGEIGALAIVDSITRLLPGVLGNAESIKYESHATTGVLEHPQYTRPEVFEAAGKKMRVPKVLLSGDHKKIAEWRKTKSKCKNQNVKWQFKMQN